MKNIKRNKKFISSLSCPSIKSIDIDTNPKAIILGSLLGDGCLKINQGYKNARFSFRHSITQQEYFMWKRNQLHKDFSSSKDFWEQKPNKKAKDYEGHKLRYQSKALPWLTNLYFITHKRGVNNNIRIWRKWLNFMTPLSLAIWWCDDGSLVKNTKQGVFCTDSFTWKDMKILDRYMKIVWKISTKIYPVGLTRKDGNKRYRLWITSTKELEKFLKIIIPHIPTYSMLYKVLILYKDSEFQQRWISEIVNNSKFTKDQVEQVIFERKNQLKFFQRKI